MALRNTSERYEYIYGSNVRKLETDTAGKQTAKTICDKVLDIVKWAYHTGAYIQSDGTVVKETFYPSGGSYSEECGEVSCV